MIKSISDSIGDSRDFRFASHQIAFTRYIEV